MLTTKVARILFSIPFLVFGMMHLIAAQGMAQLIPGWLPGGVFWVYITGLCLIAASVSIITTIQGELACKLLSIFLLFVIVLIHIPGLGNEAVAQLSMIGLLKDLGLLGGALTYVGIFNKRTKRGKYDSIRRVSKHDWSVQEINKTEDKTHQNYTTDGDVAGQLLNEETYKGYCELNSDYYKKVRF